LLKDIRFADVCLVEKQRAGYMLCKPAPPPSLLLTLSLRPSRTGDFDREASKAGAQHTAAWLSCEEARKQETPYWSISPAAMKEEVRNTFIHIARPLPTPLRNQRRSSSVPAKRKSVREVSCDSDAHSTDTSTPSESDHSTDTSTAEANTTAPIESEDGVLTISFPFDTAAPFDLEEADSERERSGSLGSLELQDDESREESSDDVTLSLAEKSGDFDMILTPQTLAAEGLIIQNTFLNVPPQLPTPLPRRSQSVPRDIMRCVSRSRFSTY